MKGDEEYGCTDVRCLGSLMSSFALFCGNKQISWRGFLEEQAPPRGKAGGTGGNRKQAKTEASTGGLDRPGPWAEAYLKPRSTLLRCRGETRLSPNTASVSV